MPKDDTLYLTTLRTAWTDLYLRVEFDRIITLSALIKSVPGVVEAIIRTNGTYNSPADLYAITVPIAAHMQDQLSAKGWRMFRKSEVLAFLEAERANISDQINAL